MTGYSLKSLSRSKARFRLGETVAARSRSQWSFTNSLNNSLYCDPIEALFLAMGLMPAALFSFDFSGQAI